MREQQRWVFKSITTIITECGQCTIAAPQMVQGIVDDTAFRHVINPWLIVYKPTINHFKKSAVKYFI